MLLSLLLLPLSSCFNTPYGSKAAYSMVAGNLSELALPCPAVGLYAIHRHGTRNIGTKLLKIFNVLTDALRHRYAREGYPQHMIWLKDFSHDHKDNKNLIEEGFIELISQGRTYHSKFPHLFSSPRISFSSSSKQRCVDSALAYLYGVFGTNYHLLNNKIAKVDYSECGHHCEVFKPVMSQDSKTRDILFDPENDHKMRYYKSCDRYVAKEETKEWKKEAMKWLKTPLMTELTETMKDDLNVPKLVALDVIAIHYMCALELSMSRLVNESHWCDLMPTGHLHISAFYIDLLRWYRKMMPEVVRASCVLVQDALTSLKNNVSANINFAHTETILPLLKYLGIVDGTMNFKTTLTERDFWGDLTPFAGHLAFVAINCSGEIQVQAILNEKPITLPKCGDPCKLDALLRIYPKESCNFAEICDVSKTKEEWNWLEWSVGGFIIVVLIAVVADLCSKEMKRDTRRKQKVYAKELKKEREAKIKWANQKLKGDNCKNKAETKKTK